MVDHFGKGDCHQSRTATEIDRVLEIGRLLMRLARGLHRLKQHLGSAISKTLHQRGVECRCILIEQRTHEGGWHFGQFVSAQPHQFDARTERIGRIYFTRPAQGLDRLVTIPELLMHFSKQPPDRRTVRLQLGCPLIAGRSLCIPAEIVQAITFDTESFSLIRGNGQRKIALGERLLMPA